MILGAVLAGGASSRFGADKAMAVWRGRTLLAHAQASLAGVVDEVVVVGRGEVPDLPCAGLGPLGGIAGALGHAARHGFESVVTIACDMPLVPRELLLELLRSAPAYCTDSPVLGCWPASAAEELIGLLQQASSCAVDCPAAGRGGDQRPASQPKDATLSVRRWAIDIGAKAVPSPTLIANINTLADLATL